MAKTKETQTNGAKRGLFNDNPFALESKNGRRSKKAKLIDESDEGSDAESGVTLKVNEDYARRFEYNKKREEQHKRKSLFTVWWCLY